jgi:pyruvate/2-oxoglutarate dehydrogenase complex dihydrolipoamide acyltransferase (E2) component
MPSPAAGTIESISTTTGQVILRGAPIPVEVKAYIDGRVVEVLANEGAVVEADAAFVQGIFGVGGETVGPIRLACTRHDERLEAERTFALLSGFDDGKGGREASVNGATQIRAGVMRPEIVVTRRAGDPEPSQGARPEEGALEIGTQVRLIRDPYFGLLGMVSALPSEPAVLGSGSKARVLEVKLGDGRSVTVPRANIELIET